MDKKEFSKKEPAARAQNAEGEPSQKPSMLAGKFVWLSDKLFGIIKFILGVCLLPFVYSVTAALLGELSITSKFLQKDFWTGVVSFLLIYFFIWEPALIYAKGQKILEFVFTFFKPLVKVAPYLLPIYSLLLIVVYLIASAFQPGWMLDYFVFLLGFTISLHLVFSAKSMRSKKGDFLKSNYLFGFSFIYILNLILLGACFMAIADKFSFVSFAKASYYGAHVIFKAVFKQLFL